MAEENERTDGFVFDFDAVFEAENYLYFYSDWLTEERTSNQTDFLIRELNLDSPRRILDLACGHGRHANRLAELGHCVVGLDASEDFLAIARHGARERGVTVQYVRADMREISYRDEFDVVLLLFTSFGYFDDAENAAVVSNVARALKAGGLFCFDTPNRDVLLKEFRPFLVVEKEGNLMIDRQSFDITTGRSTNRRIYLKDGKRTDAPFSVRLYTFTEIRDLLENNELDIHAAYGGWDGKPFATGSRRMIILAKKRG